MSDGVIYACTAGTDALTRGVTSRGTVRVIAAGEACASGEKGIQFAAPPTPPIVIEGTETGLSPKGEPIASAMFPAGDYQVTGSITVSAPDAFVHDQKVECSLVGPDGAIEPGSTVSATIPADVVAPAVTIPMLTSLHQDAAGNVAANCSTQSLMDATASSGARAATRSASRVKAAQLANCPNLSEPQQKKLQADMVITALFAHLGSNRKREKGEEIAKKCGR